jgi:ureidoacrylate peracid hydrolase
MFNYFPAIDPVRTALLVVDLQNVFMEPGQPMANPHALDIVPNVNRLTAAVRAARGRVVWTRHAVTDRGPGALPAWQLAAEELESPAMQAFIAGSFGHALHASLDVAPGDLVIDKYRYSAFSRNSSDLDAVLRAAGVDTVIVAGTMTNVCCETTARDAFMLDYKVLVVPDAMAAPTDEEHNAALLNLSAFFAHVADMEEIVRILGCAA